MLGHLARAVVGGLVAHDPPAARCRGALGALGLLQRLADRVDEAAVRGGHRLQRPGLRARSG